MWRTRNIDLLDYEVAESLGESLQYVRFYNRAKIFKRYRPKSSPYDAVVTEACLELFDDPKWLNASLAAQGFSNITEATGKPHEAIYDAIEALGNSEINPVDISIYHKIYHLYVKQGRSIKEVAEILRISDRYVRNCLSRYQLPSSASRLVTYDPYILRLFREIRYYTPDTVRLKNDGIVILGPCNICVTMSPTIKKKQSTRYKIGEHVDHYKWLPKIVPDYDDLDPTKDYPHWTIQSIVTNPIEKRVASLRLLNYALKCKDRWPKHPAVTLKRCLDSVMQEPVINSDDFWRVVEHYFGNEELQYYAEKPNQMFHILTDATDGDYVKDNKVITSRSLTECLYRKRLRIGYLSPANIQRALEGLGVVGPVFDPFPGIGCLAIACARLKIKYYYGTDDHIFNRAVEEGFLEAIGLDAEPYADQPVNYLISQNLPVSWYPFYGRKARIWSMVNGGNTYHLKLGMQAYQILKAFKVGNALRMVNFLPNESK